MSIYSKRAFSVILAAVVLLMALPSLNAATWDRPTYANSTVYDSLDQSKFSGFLASYPAFIGSTTYTSEGNEITVTGTNGWTTTTTTDGQAVLMYSITGSFRFSSIASVPGYLNSFKVELGLTSGFPNITLSIVEATADGMVNVGRALENGALVLNFQRSVPEVQLAVHPGESIRIPFEIIVAVYIPTSDNSISTASKLKDYITSVLCVEMAAVAEDVFATQGNLSYRGMEDLQDANQAFQSNLQTENQSWLNGQMGGAVDPEQSDLSSDVTAGAAELETFDQNTFQNISMYKSDLSFDLGSWSDYAAGLSYVRSIFMAVWNNSPTQIVTVALMLGLAMMLLGRGVLAVMRMQQSSGRRGGGRHA